MSSQGITEFRLQGRRLGLKIWSGSYVELLLDLDPKVLDKSQMISKL